MTEYREIDGNPSETVGATRMVSARESDDALQIETVPVSLGEVLAKHLTGIHVIVVMICAIGFEGILAVVVESTFPNLDSGSVFRALFVGTIVLLSLVFFSVVRDTDTRPKSSHRVATLTIDPDHYEIARPLLFGLETHIDGDAWELLETLQRVAHSRIAPSTDVVSTIHPMGSLRSFLIAAMSDRDRAWLLQQLETE